MTTKLGQQLAFMGFILSALTVSAQYDVNGDYKISGNLGVGAQTSTPDESVEVWSAQGDANIKMNAHGSSASSYFGRYIVDNYASPGHNFVTYLANGAMHRDGLGLREFTGENQYIDAAAITLSKKGFRYMYKDVTSNGQDITMDEIFVIDENGETTMTGNMMVHGTGTVKSGLNVGDDSTPGVIDIVNSGKAASLDFKSQGGEDWDARIRQSGAGGLLFQVSDGNSGNQTNAIGVTTSQVQMYNGRLKVGEENQNYHPELQILSTKGKNRFIGMDNDFWIESEDNIVFGTYGEGAQHMVMTTDSKIGIGTGAPSEKLTLANGRLAFTGAAVSGWGGGGPMIGKNGGGGLTVFGGSGGVAISGDPNAQDANSVFFATSGNMGIGVSAPSAKLEIGGNIKATSGADTDRGYVLHNSTSGEDVFLVRGSGHVWATEIHVDAPTAFPDYVFADDYDLMELKELENYIAVNKHLPNIPSANEISEEGNMALGGLVVKQMEKIEELTLYIIEQNKRIEELETKMK